MTAFGRSLPLGSEPQLVYLIENRAAAWDLTADMSSNLAAMKQL